ncbi:glycosyl hydrolases family 18-domain-containing protein [Neocallimastix lanati (nom. inval.)]|jgi:chitinase|nr:glycosyl hydrolases family 18-domain-containing protein [Neocallimastix sp. JGI-2020a]
MKIFLFTSILLALANFTLCFDTSKKNSCIDSKIIVGYFSEWKNANYPISRVDLSKITHLNYAFGVIDPNSYAVTGYDSNILSQVVTAAHSQGVKVLMSVGGWYGSRYFTQMTSSKSNIEKFVDSCQSLISNYGVDGIDIDWEYPGREGACNSPDMANDAENYLTLLKILREKIGNALISAAVSVIPFEKNGQPISDLSEYEKYFDYINVMAYDFAGSWTPTVSHHSALYDPEAGEKLSLSSGVKNWLSRGFPANKIVVGVPAYGKSWIAASSNRNGLYQSVANGNPKGDHEDSNSPWTNYCGVLESAYSGNWKYKNIRSEILKSDYTTASGSWVRSWDDKVKGPYLFNKETKQIITYDDPETIQYKAKYIIDNNFGGMMIWELENDTDDFEILTAINDNLGCKDSNKSSNSSPKTKTIIKSTTIVKQTTTIAEIPTVSNNDNPVSNNVTPVSSNNDSLNAEYPYCNNCVTVYEDDQKWGILNNQWCRILPNCDAIIQNCWAEEYGYSCCSGCGIVVEEPGNVNWGIEYDKWCGIINSKCGY